MLFYEQTVHERVLKTVKSLICLLWWAKPCGPYVLILKQDKVCSKDREYVLTLERTETRKIHLYHLNNKGWKEADLNYGIYMWSWCVQRHVLKSKERQSFNVSLHLPYSFNLMKRTGTNSSKILLLHNCYLNVTLW